MLCPVVGAQGDIWVTALRRSWGLVANISRDIASPDEHGRRRPGTRLFRPGVKVWVLPVEWGDGGYDRVIVGPHRDGHGQKWVRAVVKEAYLVRHRTKPIYSPSLIRAMTHESERPPHGRLYESREDAEGQTEGIRLWSTFQFRKGRNQAIEPEHLVHPTDEWCEFCAGRDAYLAGLGLDDNPCPPEEVGLEPDSFSSRHMSDDDAFWRRSATGEWRWQAGWRIAANLKDGIDLHDSRLALVAERCRTRYQDAAALAPALVGLGPDEARRLRDERHLDVSRFRWVFKHMKPTRLKGTITALLHDNTIVECEPGTLTAATHAVDDAVGGGKTDE